MAAATTVSTSPGCDPFYYEEYLRDLHAFLVEKFPPGSGSSRAAMGPRDVVIDPAKLDGKFFTDLFLRRLAAHRAKQLVGRVDILPGPSGEPRAVHSRFFVLLKREDWRAEKLVFDVFVQQISAINATAKEHLTSFSMYRELPITVGNIVKRFQNMLPKWFPQRSFVEGRPEVERYVAGTIGDDFTSYDKRLRAEDDKTNASLHAIAKQVADILMGEIFRDVAKGFPKGLLPDFEAGAGGGAAGGAGASGADGATGSGAA